MELSDGKVVPITILTGFLGAGKTTLLNRIVNGNHGLRVAVLVNDFGSINIDSQLVIGVKDNVISLANGCICCTIRDDLVATVTQTINRPEAPEYILLEASGIADPSGIAMAFVDPGLRERIRLDSIICVVDAEQVFDIPELMELKLRQIAFSDMLILNKVGLAGPEQVDKVRALLDDRFNRLRIVETNYCEVPYEILLGVGRFDATRADLNLHAVEHDHSKVFSTWSYETNQPLALEALRETMRKLPGTIYRAKGVIYTTDEPKRRAVLQVVGRRVDISLQEGWGQRVPRTQIVVIGAAGSIDANLMEKTFTSCISTAAATAGR